MYTMIMKNLHLCLLLVCIAVLPMRVGATNTVVAVVNDAAISAVDLEQRLQLAMISSGLPATEDVKTRLRPQILQLLIEEELYAQEAERLNINVTEDDIAFAIRSLEQKNNLSEGEFPEFIRERGATMAAIRGQLTSQIQRNRIMSRIVRPKVVVTEREIQERIENVLNQSGLAEYNISEIVLPIESTDKAAQAENFANDLVSQIQEGQNFSVIAHEFSSSVSASNGGLLGWVDAEILPPQLVQAVKTADEGTVVGPIRVDNAWYILKVDGKRALQNNPIGETEIGLRQIMLPLSDRDDSDAIETKRAALSKAVDTSLNSCNDAEAFANEVDSAVSPDMMLAQLKSLAPAIGKEVATLRVNQVTPVIRTDAGLHVFIVCERTDAQPTLAVRQKVRELIFSSKMALAGKRYQRDLRRNAYIEIR